jgi:hypothetical protein
LRSNCTQKKTCNLVEAEALGRVGQDVGVDRVSGVRSPVGDRTFLGRQGLEDAAQPREHGQSAVLQFLDLQLFQVARFSQAQRVESATRGDVTRDESVVKRVGRQASSVRFGTANQDGFDDQNVPEGRVARAFRRQRGDGARELVRDGGAVIRGAQGTGGEPRDTGAVFGGPGTSDAQLGPSAVDDFTLGVLFVAERDDRGFAPTRVRTEFRVDIGVLVLFLKFFSKNRKGLPQLSSFYAHVYRSLSKTTTTATGATPRNDRFRVDANEHFFSRRVPSVVVVVVVEGFAFGEPRGAVHRSTGGEELFVGRGWRARVTDDA